MVLFLITQVLSALLLANPQSVRIIDHVDPFIGTSNGGNTFPGAVLPWGMISLSPQNSMGSTFGAPSGYLHGEPFLYGLGHNHLSGTGCADLGNIIVTAVADLDAGDPEKYRSKYSNEKASPGYYSVFLEKPGITVESTVSIRSGILRFTSASGGNVKLLVDASRNLNGQLGGSIKLNKDGSIEGVSISGGFCGEENRKEVFFVMRPSNEWSGVTGFRNGKKFNESSTLDEYESVILEFEETGQNPLSLKTAISYVSIENARQNLESELGDKTFNDVLYEAEQTWETTLSRIVIQTSDDEDKIKFYSAIYHTLIHPNIINDINGEFPIYQSGETGTIDRYSRYTVYSLWDTYRTLHPFLTLVYPERQLEMVSTMTEMAKEWGFLPKWELVSNETYMMVGDPASVIIADTYLKGIRDFGIHSAFKAIQRTIEEAATPEAMPSRPGYYLQKQYGYIPFEQDLTEDWWAWGPVSTTLEYNYADWAAGHLAKALGYHDVGKQYINASFQYRNLFNPETKLIQPKMMDGSWLSPFDPLATEGSGDWEGSGGPGYVEGNAWNYTWFVNHDVPGLIELFGGEELFKNKLLECFDEGHFTITNEPDMAYPYLFTYLKNGEPVARRIVHDLVETEFGTGPGGLPGNDDAGAISTWLIFSMLGMFPVDPISGTYQLTVPAIDKAVIQVGLKGFESFKIDVENISGQSGLPAEFMLNGKKLDKPILTHDQILNGGLLKITY